MLFSNFFSSSCKSIKYCILYNSLYAFLDDFPVISFISNEYIFWISTKSLCKFEQASFITFLCSSSPPIVFILSLSRKRIIYSLMTFNNSNLLFESFTIFLCFSILTLSFFISTSSLIVLSYKDSKISAFFSSMYVDVSIAVLIAFSSNGTFSFEPFFNIFSFIVFLASFLFSVFIKFLASFNFSLFILLKLSIVLFNIF